MIKTVKLMMGIDELTGAEIFKNGFKGLSWWSDNMETLAHYYEGCAIEITVKLDSKKAMEFVRDWGELSALKIPIGKYTYGSAEVICPKGATWYSFNADYLAKNVIKIEEIFPDLSEWNEEGYND